MNEVDAMQTVAVAFTVISFLVGLGCGYYMGLVEGRSKWKRK